MGSECERGRNAAKRLKCAEKIGGFWDQRSKSTFIRTQAAEKRQEVTMKKEEFQSSRHIISTYFHNWK